MRRTRLFIIIVGFVLIIGSQIFYTILLATPEGIRIRSPEGSVTLDRSFVVAGDAWMRTGLKAIQIVVEKKGDDDPTTFSFSGIRDAVKSRGKVLEELSSWSARVELPSDGDWELHAVALGTDGHELASSPRSVVIRDGVPIREFRSWTPEHLIPMVIIAIGAIGLGFFTRAGKKASLGKIEVSRRYTPVMLCITVVMWLNELIYQVYWFTLGGWSPAAALMLQMCGLSILFMPVMFFSEHQKTRQFLFDIIYFWGIGGALQALITPDIGTNGFPALKYFGFFISHGLIITGTVVMAIAGGVSITPRSFLRVCVITNLFMIPIYGVNHALALIPPYDVANYFVLGYPPPTGSVVDVFADIFGPSPRYVIGLELMGVVVFGLLYLPWPIARRRDARSRPHAA